MTLQAAFVAANGVVISSDEKSNACEDGHQDYINPIIRRENKLHKIILAENQALVCAYSGNDIAAYAAQKLTESAPEKFLDDEQVKKHLQQAPGFARNFTGAFGSTQVVIAAIPNAMPSVHRLWRVLWVDDGLVLPITDKLYAGDTNNSAIFFGERYHSSTLPVEKLKLLAAHIVLEGHRRNGLRVGGLEVFVSEDGKTPRFLSDDELDLLRKQSEDAGKKLADLLLYNH